MLSSEPGVQPLLRYAEALASRENAVVPLFDPSEAGVEAKVLFLLEAPGPMTHSGNERPGSGFISVDNDDLTAANLWSAREHVGLHEGVLHWNIVPWYLGPASVHPSAPQLARGASELRRLLPLLPKLRGVVLCGSHARNGWNRHVAPFGSDLLVRPTWHPSPRALNQSPSRRAELLHAVEVAAGWAS